MQKTSLNNIKEPRNPFLWEFLALSMSVNNEIISIFLSDFLLSIRYTL